MTHMSHNWMFRKNLKFDLTGIELNSKWTVTYQSERYELLGIESERSLRYKVEGPWD